MSEEKYKQIAPAVVLAQHGNKGAYRELYIAYYKNIFFICNSMLEDVTAAIDLTCAIFVKMFETVDKLGDHKAFEQWFYSLAINMCRQKIKASEEEKQTVLKEEVLLLANEAAECAVKKDHFGFEHKIMKIIDGMITSMPLSPRIILLYYYFAGLDAEKIALLEKITPEEAQQDIKAIDAVLNMQCEKLKNQGIDMSVFIENMGNSLGYTAQKSFVPDGVHSKVSEQIGVDVNPFAPSPKEKEEMVEQAKNHIKEEEKKAEKKVKKNFFTKGDLILFFGVIAAALIVFGIFSGYKQWKRGKDETTTYSSSTQLQEKPALLWNGAAAGSFDGGSGTKEDPFQIATGAQLAYLANLVNSGNSAYAGYCYILSADIILNETENISSWATEPPAHTWTPIGYYNSESDNSCFTGTFDGNGHTVTGLYINSEKDYSGLFGIIRNGTVKNLVVEEAFVRGKNYTGGIAGCYISDSAGGSITDCGFSGSVSSAESYAGGITGAVKAQGEDASARISGCYSRGTASAKNYSGGIAGSCEAQTGESRILNSYSSSSINSSDFAGGLCGLLSSDSGEAAFWYCYSAGEISCQGENSGGLAGRLEAAGETGKTEVLFCYWLNTSASAGAYEENPKIVIENSLPLSDSQMASPESFSEFDFSEIWIFRPEQNSESYKYPVLRYSVEF